MPRFPRRRNALVVHVHHLGAAFRSGKSVENRPGRIRRTIVNKNHLDVRCALRLETFQTDIQIAVGVITRHNHADVANLGHKKPLPLRQKIRCARADPQRDIIGLLFRAQLGKTNALRHAGGNRPIKRGRRPCGRGRCGASGDKCRYARGKAPFAGRFSE